jgi:hypothetical protein
VIVTRYKMCLFFLFYFLMLCKFVMITRFKDLTQAERIPIIHPLVEHPYFTATHGGATPAAAAAASGKVGAGGLGTHVFKARSVTALVAQRAEEGG